jgi:hypothetical protein
MKLIINCQRYDTETATTVATWNNGARPDSFQLSTETLYKTPKGAYFLHLEGGPYSEYGEQVPGASRGTSRLRPLTNEETMGWLEKRERTEALEREFPDQIHDA